MTDKLVIEKIKTDEGNTTAITSVLNEVVQQGGELFQQLLQVAMTNGLVGACLMLYINDILYRKNIIGVNTFNAAFGLVIAGAGISLTDEILTSIGNALVPKFSATSSASFATPSVNVLVLGNKQDTAQLNALLQGLSTKK